MNPSMPIRYLRRRKKSSGICEILFACRVRLVFRKSLPRLAAFLRSLCQGGDFVAVKKQHCGRGLVGPHAALVWPESGQLPEPGHRAAEPFRSVPGGDQDAILRQSSHGCAHASNTNATVKPKQTAAACPDLPGRPPPRKVQVGDRDSEIRMAGVGLGRVTNRARYGRKYSRSNRYKVTTGATETTLHGSVT